jgi:DNA-binding GntR family transcriptional regulator
VARQLKLDKTSSLAEQAYAKLHAAIQNGEFAPGGRLMEADVAKWLKMSRTPARDALRRLENEGLLVHEPRFGLVIASLDYRAVVELYMMREVLEATAAGFAARHASDFEISQLTELVEEEKTLQGDYEALARHNKRFHTALHRAAHNRYLLRSLNTVADSMGLLGRSLMTIPERAKSALDEHTQIVRAIEDHDQKAAEGAARAHVRTAMRERLKIFEPA